MSFPRLVTSALGSPASLNTSKCFDEKDSPKDSAALDKFIQNHRQINLVATLELLEAHPVLGGLALLGSVSAVESYVREVVRRTIVLDEHSRNACYLKQVTYGAAYIHKTEMLPEALLEDVSFASAKNLMNVLKDFIGIPIQVHRDTQPALDAFDDVCQFRHCVVHRFGRLGTKNAINLDLDTHRQCVEKPLRLEYGSLQTVFAINHNLVREVNDHIFTQVLKRTVDKQDWQGSWPKDRTRFLRYWRLFVSIEQPNPQLPRPQDVYAQIVGPQ
jgi:hypothetical protein